MQSGAQFPNNLQEAIKHYADPDNALNAFVKLRWPGGIFCPRCGSDKHGFLSTRRIWKCKVCKKQFSAKVGTVLEDSPLKLETWLAGIWLTVNAKNGISSHEIGRSLGITQKSAWFMLGRIRHAIQRRSFDKLAGVIEADETFVGGLEKNKHTDKRLNPGGGTIGKAAVFALLERGKTSRVRATHVSEITAGRLQGEIELTVKKDSALFTDESKSYHGMTEQYYRGTVNHSVGEYARGEVHTNGLENWFSLFKRCFKGTWTHLSEEHLQRYLTEQEFRFDNRKSNDTERFIMALAMTPGKRLTWKELTERGLTTIAP
jgi:transposase-like protein